MDTRNDVAQRHLEEAKAFLDAEDYPAAAEIYRWFSDVLQTDKATNHPETLLDSMELGFHGFTEKRLKSELARIAQTDPEKFAKLKPQLSGMAKKFFLEIQ